MLKTEGKESSRENCGKDIFNCVQEVLMAKEF